MSLRFNLEFEHSPSRTILLIGFFLKVLIKQVRVYLHYFHRYPNILPFEEPSEFDSLTEEFNEYQLLRDCDIPDHVMESCKTN